jgi:AcrR family transcriptional regulator
MATVTAQNSSQASSVTAERRRREKEQRYQSILEAAERLFCEKGYSNTKIQDIAQAAEVAVGTVYFHFRSKEDLLLQLIDAIAFNVRSTLGEAFRSGSDPVERFENAGRVLFLQFSRLHRHQLILLLRESVGISSEVEARRQRIFEKLNQDVARAIEEVMGEYGVANRSVAEIVSVAIGGMLERVAHQYLIWQDRSDDIEAISREVLAFIRGGLMSVLMSPGQNQAARGGSRRENS